MARSARKTTISTSLKPLATVKVYIRLKVRHSKERGKTTNVLLSKQQVTKNQFRKLKMNQESHGHYIH